MKYIPVQAVANQLADQFGIEMNLDQIVRHSAQCLKNMGMIALQREVIVAEIENFQINLPGRVRKVRATFRLDDSPLIHPAIAIQDIRDSFPIQSFWVSDAEATPITNDNIRNNYVPQLKGPYINHVWECPYLRFNETDIKVGIIATSIKADKNGWPMIPEEAQEACTYYCLYVYHQPLFLIGKIDGQRMGAITEWKNQKMRFAETQLMLTELSQGEMDGVFDAMTSFDRKQFGISM